MSTAKDATTMTSEGAISIDPFRIDVPQGDLNDLRQRLARTRFAPDIPGVGWAYGTPTAWLRDMVAYWKDGFDWRYWEAKLNAYRQYTTEIDGQRLHFLHIPSSEKHATPLVLLHGWPSSFVEFLHVIVPLTNPVAHGGRAEDAFHLVVPSLPGFAFSGPTSEPGWDAGRMARAVAALMAALGHDRYGVQGGDWGGLIAAYLGQFDANHVTGIHLNAAVFGFDPRGEVTDDELALLTQAERTRLERRKHFNSDGNGYFRVQATRPQTVGAALSDSPVGQLAWIGEKLVTWSHKDSPIDRDIVLVQVMLYSLTNTSASSARIYYESVHSGVYPTSVKVPTGVAVFAEDTAIRRFGEQMYNIVHWSEFDCGGHFPAMEVPDLLVDDIRTFFAKVQNRH
jgi:pimeloyl-ACP methyl ester carboxylesterase